MDIFARDLVPVSGRALMEIDEQATETLKGNLSARRFVDVKGPLGWDCASVAVGRFVLCETDGPVGCGVRLSVPLIESRVDFELDALEMHNIDRGCEDADFIPLEIAAKAAAAFEDGVVYNGFESAGIRGMSSSSENAPLSLPLSDPSAFVKAVADEIYRMKTVDSIAGPYALVGGKSLCDALSLLVSGRTLLEVIKRNADIDEYIFTPSFDGAFLVSKRGGDFELTLGGDFAIGYTCRDGNKLKFYLTESFAFRILEPRAYSPLLFK